MDNGDFIDFEEIEENNEIDNCFSMSNFLERKIIKEPIEYDMLVNFLKNSSYDYYQEIFKNLDLNYLIPGNSNKYKNENHKKVLVKQLSDLLIKVDNDYNMSIDQMADEIFNTINYFDLNMDDIFKGLENKIDGDTLKFDNCFIVYDNGENKGTLHAILLKHFKALEDINILIENTKNFLNKFPYDFIINFYTLSSNWFYDKNLVVIDIYYKEGNE